CHSRRTEQRFGNRLGLVGYPQNREAGASRYCDAHRVYMDVGNLKTVDMRWDPAINSLMGVCRNSLSSVMIEGEQDRYIHQAQSKRRMGAHLYQNPNIDQSTKPYPDAARSQ